MGKKVSLAGKTFGQLFVIKESGRDKWKRKRWLCKCICGTKKEIDSRHLVNGKTKTCGCKTGVQAAKSCLGKTGEAHPKWKGGRYLTADGYWMVYVEAGKYMLEHRIVAGVTDPNLVVHHKNHIKTDNRPENLEVMTRSEHAIEHKFGTAIGESGAWYLVKAAEALEE